MIVTRAKHDGFSEVVDTGSQFLNAFSRYPGPLLPLTLALANIRKPCHALDIGQDAAQRSKLSLIGCRA